MTYFHHSSWFIIIHFKLLRYPCPVQIAYIPPPIITLPIHSVHFGDRVDGNVIIGWSTSMYIPDLKNTILAHSMSISIYTWQISHSHQYTPSSPVQPDTVSFARHKYPTNHYLNSFPQKYLQFIQSKIHLSITHFVCPPVLTTCHKIQQSSCQVLRIAHTTLLRVHQEIIFHMKCYIIWLEIIVQNFNFNCFSLFSICPINWVHLSISL